MRSGRNHAPGFTMVEILVTIVILGVLSTVVVFGVRAITDKGEQSACGADTDVLVTAADVYFVENDTDTIPATGSGIDRFERTLVASGLIREVSTKYELNADGTVTTNGDPCT